MKLVLEDGYLRGEGEGDARDIEIVGISFLEYEWDGWLSTWHKAFDETIPTQGWLIDNELYPEKLRAWKASDDVDRHNWIYECRRISIMEDDD